MSKDYEKKFIKSAPVFLAAIFLSMFFAHGSSATVLIIASGIAWVIYIFVFGKDGSR